MPGSGMGHLPSASDVSSAGKSIVFLSTPGLTHIASSAAWCRACHNRSEPPGWYRSRQHFGIIAGSLVVTGILQFVFIPSRKPTALKEEPHSKQPYSYPCCAYQWLTRWQRSGCFISSARFLFSEKSSTNGITSRAVTTSSCDCGKATARER